MKLFAVLLLFFSVVAFALPQTASAALVDCGIDAGDACGFCDLFQLFNRIILFLLFPGDINNGFALILLVATFFIVYGGIRILLARGSETEFSNGKKIIWAVVIGLILVYSAFALVNTVMSSLGATNVSWTGLSSWWEIECK